MDQVASRSSRTKIIFRALVAVFVFALALMIALFVCYAADMFGVGRGAIGVAFPIIITLIVYVAVPLILLRLAYAWSLHNDRR